MMRRYFISDKFNIALLNIPKCGMTSLCKALEINMQLDWVPLGGLHAWDFKSETGPHHKDRLIDKKKIAVLRNPTERILSGWQECLRRGTTKAKTFCEFVLQIKDQGFFDEHIEPMYKYFPDFTRKYVDLTALDQAINFENIGKHFAGIEALNKSEEYSKAMTNTTQMLLYQIYKQDYELYKMVP